MARGAKMEICTAEAPDMPAPGFRHRLHGERRLGDAEPGPAIFLRHGGADPAAGREGRDELAGKFAVAIARQPIAIVEPLAEPQHVVADHLLLVAQHGLPPLSSRPAGKPSTEMTRTTFCSPARRRGSRLC